MAVSSIKNIVKSSIGKASSNVLTFTDSGDTEAIIKAIQYGDERCAEFTKELSRRLHSQFGADYYSLFESVWHYLHFDVRYEADKSHQKIKSPAQLVKDGVGDCKSYSVFVASIAQNLGLTYQYKFVDYVGDGIVNHVFPVVHVSSGKEKIIVDAVYDKYNESQIMHVSQSE